MTIETPILRVISILCEAQEKCPANVSVRLEEALEILRSPDLYTPTIPPSSHISSSIAAAAAATVSSQQQQQQSDVSPSSSVSTITTSGAAAATTTTTTGKPTPGHPSHLARGSSLTSSIGCNVSSSISASGLINQASRQESDADEITTDLFTGLIHSNKPITGIRRMSYEAAVAHRQSFSSLRDFSPPVPSPAITSGPISILNPPESIKLLLDNQLTWDFDAIKLEQLTSGKPLVWLGLSIANHFNVCATLNCDESTFVSWLSLIESNYHSNPYHNSTHAADVMQAAAYYLTKPRIEALFDPLDEAISLIAAICHDIDHPGKTSAFLCNSQSDLAILYNDTSVLESHHAALTFKLTLSHSSVNIFKNLDKETFKEVRSSVIDMILATEMTKHFEHLTKFVNVFTQVHNNNSCVDECLSLSSSQTTGDAKTDEDTLRRNIRSSSLSTPENIVLVKRMLIKCADVSNPTRPLSLCIIWANRIAEEYCNQTDEEKARGLPVVMPVFDRATCSIPKSQLGFIDFFANDMFQAWDSFGEFHELIELLKSNYLYWQGQQRVRESSVTSTSSTSSAPAAINSCGPINVNSSDVTDTGGGNGGGGGRVGGRNDDATAAAAAASALSSRQVVTNLHSTAALVQDDPLTTASSLVKNVKILGNQGINESNVSNVSTSLGLSECNDSIVDDIQCYTDTQTHHSTSKLLSETSDYQATRLQSNNVSSKCVTSNVDDER